MGTGYAVTRILDVYPQLNSEGVEGVLAYGSFACVERRFVYVQIPKAACTAVKRLLREVVNASPLRLFGWSARETRRSMFIHDRDNVPIPPLTALDSALQRELLESPDVLRFTIVRNPYTRLVSAWRDKVVLCEPCVEDVYAAVRGEPPPLENKTILSFGEFVSYIERATYWDGHWGRQVDLCFPQALSFNHVGKVEQLSATVCHLTKHLDFAVPLSPSNETLLRFQAGYSEELAARVHTLYAADFEAFDYDPRSWPRDELEVATVSQEQIIDAIIERNLVISHLYEEKERLQALYLQACRSPEPQ